MSKSETTLRPNPKKWGRNPRPDLGSESETIQMSDQRVSYGLVLWVSDSEPKSGLGFRAQIWSRILNRNLARGCRLQSLRPTPPHPLEALSRRRHIRPWASLPNLSSSGQRGCRGHDARRDRSKIRLVWRSRFWSRLQVSGHTQVPQGQFES